MAAPWAVPHPVHVCMKLSAAWRRVLIQDTNKRTVQDIKGRLATVTDLPGNGWVMAQLDNGEAPFRIQQRQAELAICSGYRFIYAHYDTSCADNSKQGLVVRVNEVLDSAHMHILASWDAEVFVLLLNAGTCAMRRLLRAHQRCRQLLRRPGHLPSATPRCRRGH